MTSGMGADHSLLDQLLLAHHLPDGAVKLSAGESRGYYRTSFELDREKFTELADVVEQNGELVEATDYVLLSDKKKQTRETARLENASSTGVLHLRRFAKQSAVADEYYTLLQAKLFRQKAIANTIKGNELVSDFRLGEQRQVAYRYRGALPTENQLRRMLSDKHTNNNDSTLPPVNMNFIGGGLFVIGLFLVTRPRRRS